MRIASARRRSLPATSTSTVTASTYCDVYPDMRLGHTLSDTPLPIEVDHAGTRHCSANPGLALGHHALLRSCGNLPRNIGDDGLVLEWPSRFARDWRRLA